MVMIVSKIFAVGVGYTIALNLLKSFSLCKIFILAQDLGYPSIITQNR